jgi:hypothetical protein
MDGWSCGAQIVDIFAPFFEASTFSPKILTKT